MLFTRARLRLLPLFLIAAVAIAAEDDVRPLTILHTNDLHAHLLPNDQGLGGFAQLATALRREREHCSPCLYLNAGDLVQGTPVSTIFHGVPVYEIANLLGIDVSTLGNHDFDYGCDSIPKFLTIARFPIVSANVVNDQGTTIAPPYAIKTVDGLKVGVIGAVMGNLVGVYETKETMGLCHVLPVVETVRRIAAELMNHVDVVVLLAHVEDHEADELLHTAPEIPILIAGHVHTGFTSLKEFEGRVAVEGRAYGAELDRLDLRIDIKRHKVVSSDWKRIPIDKRFPPAPDVASLISEWEAKVSKVVDVPIGESKRRLTGPDLVPLVETAMREETGSDFAFVNRGNIREVLPQGQLLARNVWNILPFDNYIVIGTFKGRDLPATVTKGHAVDPDKEYTLATSDFTAANQSAPTQLGVSGLAFDKKGPLQRDAVIDWIKKKRVIE
jgi:2',3'-cyclic-nucleotide 2'-phosphodiesterase (5'-nucleotidase family)